MFYYKHLISGIPLSNLLHKDVPLVALSTVSQQPHEVFVPHPPDCFNFNLEFPLCLSPNKPGILPNSATQKPHVTQHHTFGPLKGSFHTKHANHNEMLD
jgi:hypothetical protein